MDFARYRTCACADSNRRAKSTITLFGKLHPVMKLKRSDAPSYKNGSAIEMHEHGGDFKEW
jgi:hypothetical protein